VIFTGAISTLATPPGRMCVLIQLQAAINSFAWLMMRQKNKQDRVDLSLKGYLKTSFNVMIRQNNFSK
jgi:hypothetical protein